MADELAKAYGGKHLFDDAVFQVEEGDRIAIVGPNGAGKSTLLRILAGQERADHGTLKVRDGVRAHFFDQHPVVPKGATVRDLLATPLAAPVHLAKERDDLEARIADPALYEQPGYEEVLARFAELEQEIKRATAPPTDAWDTPFVKALGFKPADLDRPGASLSGGEKTRLFLARTMSDIREGDLVVLDEPTNHLDVDTIEWLERWMREFQGTILVVAHDRVFLDRVATRVFAVGAGKVTVYPGNYSDYVTLRDENDDRLRREHEKAIGELKKAEATIAQFKHQKRFDGQYASRMKMVERHRASAERAPDPIMQQAGFGLGFDAEKKSSNEMIRLQDIHKGFGEKIVLGGVSLEIKKGERLGVVGPNGAGKSTLIRIMTGKEAKDAGTIHVAPGVKGTFLTQENDDLDVDRTLQAEVQAARPHIDDDGVKALLGRFSFDPDKDRIRKVGTLSGGERRRMALLKAVLKPSNLLIMDEPTNHLDLDAREIVAAAINTYPGTVVVVSHDRFLLDSVTTATAVVTGGQVYYYPGTFTETRDRHPKATVKIVVKKTRFTVKKKFTDWATDRRFTYAEEVLLGDEELESNRAIRNALAQGWLERA